MRILTAGLDDMTLDALRQNGHNVEVQEVEDAEDLLIWFQDGLYDAGVINLDHTGLGIYAARGLRSKKIQIPLLGIMGATENGVWSDQRALFLESGGDDLLRDPINPRELLASIQAVTRRLKGSLLDIREYKAGEAILKVNMTTNAVYLNGVRIMFTRRELQIVLLLASNPGRPILKTTFISNMYTEGVDDEPDVKIVDVFMCKIRNKLKRQHPDAGQFIETVWGNGYRLSDKTLEQVEPSKTSRARTKSSNLRAV